MTKEIGENTIVFYDSIKNLPNARKFLASSYQLWSSNVGTEMQKVRANMVKAIEHIAYDKKQDAITLIQNADMGIESILSQEDFELKELCCYIKSINERLINFELFSKDVDEMASFINSTGISISEVEDLLENIKKK